MSESRRWIERSGTVGGAVFVLALALRLVYLWDGADNPTFLTPIIDSETYDRLARAIVAGGGLTHEFFWQPPFYPAFLSVVYTVSGSSILVAKLLQAVLGALTVWLTFRLGERVFDRRAGLLAGAITALYGPLLFFDGELLATGWAAFWSVSLILLSLRAVRPGGGPFWLALGLCGGLAVITRPTFLPFLVVACGWMFVRGRQSGRRPIAELGLLVAGLTAVWLPAVGLAYQYTGRFSLLPASAGINLYIGNNANAAHTISIRPGSEWTELTNLPRRHGVTERRDTGRFFRGRVTEYARRDPAGLMRGLAVKGGHLLSSRELPRNVDIYVFREWSVVLRSLVWKVGNFGFPFGLLLPVAAIGAVLCRNRLPGPLIAFVVLYPLSVVLVFVSARYRTPLVPALSVLAAGGCLALPGAVRAGRRGPAVLAGGAAIGLLLVGTLAGPFPQERTDYRAELEYALGTRAMTEGDTVGALNHLRRAVDLDDRHADAADELGLAYARLNNAEAALEHFRQALGIRPAAVEPRLHLARLLVKLGRRDEALKHFETAVEHDPFDLDLRYHFGTTLVTAGRFAEAEEHLSWVVGSRPEDPDARNALAAALRGQGRLELALPLLESALRLDDLHHEVLDNLALALVELGRPAEAAAVYREALVRARAAGDAPLARHIERRLGR